MSLKKPDSIPKIPKTRKKKAQSALDAIPAKKPDKLEYSCKSYYKYDEAARKQFCVFAIETVVEFTNFSYEVSVDVVQEKNVINFILMGLKANMNVVPMVQPAKKEMLFQDLVGDYIVNVVKQDGAINTGEFHFNIYKKEIVLTKQYKPKKKNNRLFCKFEVAEEEFSFPENNKGIERRLIR
ncbi:MAG: hypothetical protein CVV24_03825 [Ignavibacteriae bacterium HGW-Ignavibacteriae-3]|nr:MAG: hypothetical protein CVV24_03825 [Ignavibacteriae bacterium HGW-Ignavibacteriae-3]